MSAWRSHVYRRRRSRRLWLPAFLPESDRMPRPFGRSPFAADFSTGSKRDVVDEELRTDFQRSMHGTPTLPQPGEEWGPKKIRASNRKIPPLRNGLQIEGLHIVRNGHIPIWGAFFDLGLQRVQGYWFAMDQKCLLGRRLETGEPAQQFALSGMGREMRQLQRVRAHRNYFAEDSDGGGVIFEGAAA